MNEEHLDFIFSLYGDARPELLETHDSGRGGDDLRYSYVVRYEGRDKLVIKAAKNSFTTPERICGWAALCGHYNDLGIYCPRFIKNKYGRYYAEANGCMVYAEEFTKYEIADKNGRKLESAGYKKKMFESLGLVAAHPAPIVPWHTAFCLYDTFAQSDLYDENYECAVEFNNFFLNNFPGLGRRATDLFNLYKQKRAAFEEEYRALPKTVFQGDLNTSNVLLTESGDFTGLIDFNLSGTETILNYLFCECCQYLEDESEIERLMDGEALRERDRETAENLSHAGRRYAFTPEERLAFPDYYNIVMPFRWPYQCFFMKLLRREPKYAAVILDWVEYQLTRRDAAGLLP